jgi:hypothetical protein
MQSKPGTYTAGAAAAAVVDKPSTIRDRNASACADVRRRAHRVSVSRSCSVNTNSGFGRPRDPTRESSHPPTQFAV